MCYGAFSWLRPSPRTGDDLVLYWPFKRELSVFRAGHREGDAELTLSNGHGVTSLTVALSFCSLLIITHFLGKNYHIAPWRTTASILGRDG